MPWIKYESLACTATTSSGVTTNTANAYNGLLHAIRYTVSTSAPMSTDGRVTITGTRTGITALIITNLGSTAGGTYYPRLATVLSTSAETGSTGAAEVPLFNETLTLVFSTGSTGGTKAGTFEFFVT